MERVKIAAAASFVLALAATVIVACGGGGGGAAGSPPQEPLKPPAANLTGTWSVTETSGSNTCGDPVGVADSYTVSVNHPDQSNSMTMTRMDTLDVLTTTVSGSTVSYDGAGYDPSCSSFTMSMNITINTEKDMSGATSWVCYYSGTSCSGTDTIVATKQPPTLASFTPMTGSTGTTVTITGTNFSTVPANNIVKFNGVAAVVSSSTSTRITTSVPVSATTGSITVTVSGQTGTSVPIFTVTNSTAAEVEPNDTSGTAQTITAGRTIIGTSTGGYTSGNQNVDYYKFIPSTTKSYTITLSFESTADLDLDLYNAALSLLRFSETSAYGGKETITYSMSGGVTYYIFVGPWETTGGTTNYTLTVQ